MTLLSEAQMEAFADGMRVNYRQNQYQKTGNGIYAAQAWTIVRKYNISIPGWILVAVDEAATRGYFFLEKAVGKGNKNDRRREATDTLEIQSFIVVAYDLWTKNPSWSQEKLAHKLKINPAQFSRLLDKWEIPGEPYPWRSIDRKGLT